MASEFSFVLTEDNRLILHMPRAVVKKVEWKLSGDIGGLLIILTSGVYSDVDTVPQVHRAYSGLVLNGTIPVIFTGANCRALRAMLIPILREYIRRTRR